MKPCWEHSIHLEKDFKSPLEALRQGFLMEQSLLDIFYVEDLQRFEFCYGYDLQNYEYDTPELTMVSQDIVNHDEKPQCFVVSQHNERPARDDLSCHDVDATPCYLVPQNYKQSDHDKQIDTNEHESNVEQAHPCGTSTGLVSLQDLNTLCAELYFDAEDLCELGVRATRPDMHHFYMYVSCSLGTIPVTFELTACWSECSDPQFWYNVVSQIVKSTHHQAVQVLRAHGSEAERLAGIHHVIIVPWKIHEIPALLQWTSKSGNKAWLFDAAKISKMRDIQPLDATLHQLTEHYQFWQAGRKILLDDSIVQQCGTNIVASPISYGRMTARFGDEDVVEPPCFDIGMDEDVVLPEDVQGRDEVIAVISDDENLILQAITAHADADTLHLILFGYDGTALGRRDADASPVSFEGMQRAIERCWHDYQGHLVKPYLVQPQPEALAREGLVFVVAIQHIFAAAPIPSVGCVLGLAGIQLTYAGSIEPEIHRAVELEDHFCSADVRASLQITRLCKPFGRRHCDMFCGIALMEEGSQHEGFNGVYIKADIQEERMDFDIRRACRDFDSIVQDLNLARQDPHLNQIRFMQYGHRFRSIGRVNQLWDHTAQPDELSLAQHFAQGWLSQPLDRMQIFRIRALDAVNSDTGVLMLHFIVAFDLVPGHSVCAAMSGNTEPTWTISGPHLLQPQHWDLNGLDPSIPNPIRESNYELLLFPGRRPTLTMDSGDAILYVDNEPNPGDDGSDAEDTSLLQLQCERDRLPERDFAVAPPRVKSCPAYELPGLSQRSGRVVELFPLLWSDCDEVPLRHSEVECERFLQACKQFPLRQDIPASFEEYILPITRAYLETCAEDLGPDCEYHIYTDGSSFIAKSDGHAERDGTWSAVVFQVRGTKRHFVGWTAGFVIVDEQNKRFIGAADRHALQAERSGIFWIMAWTLGLPPGHVVHLHVDNQAACFGATGQWTYAMTDDLALRTRAMVLLVNERHDFQAHHVKSHTQQPQNEFADAITRAIADDCESLSFKNATIDRNIAAFQGYETYWFRLVSNSILPPVHQNNLVLLPVEEDREFVPSLARAQDLQWKYSKAPHRAELELFVSTYNVLSLRHCDPTGDVDADSVFPGKTKYLANQMLDQKLHILMLQECRSANSGIFENRDIVRVMSAGLPDGTLGTEIWLNKKHPLGSNGNAKLYFTKPQLFVLRATPRMLVLKINFPDKHIVVISGHCPHSMDTYENRSQWWNQLSQIMSRLHEDDMLICGCDFNARLPMTILPHIGDLTCEKGNSNTHFMVEYVKAHDLILPSTFSEMHNGPSATWRHSTGRVARLDYLAVKKGQWSSLSSTAWSHLDAGNAIPDHSSTALHLKVQWSTKLYKQNRAAIDWEEVRAPQHRDEVCRLIASIPVSPWATMPSKQVECLHLSVHELLRQRFPLKRSRPRKPYISPSTWTLRQSRKRILASLRMLRMSENQNELQHALDRWRMRTACGLPERWAHFAVRPLVSCFLLRQLKLTSVSLRTALRADKASFVTKIAENACQADGTEVYKALAPLRVGSRFTKRGIEPLPMWKTENGEHAQSFEQRLDVWRKQCSDLEAGELITPNDLQCHAIDRAAERRRMVPPVEFADFPSVLELEDRLRKIKRNKTAGNDGLCSDVFAIAAPQFAKHLFSISAKLVVTLQEPIQSKGGTLVAAYKGSGAADVVSNYRSLLLSSHFGKALRSFWRQQTIPLYTGASSSLHFAGKKGGNVSHPSMLLQALLQGASRCNHSTSAVFLDIKAAYYRVVRELVVNMTTSDEDIARVLRCFDLPPSDYELLRRHLQNPDILSDIGAGTRHRAILDELLTSTWFTIAGDAQVVRTQAGSRPGDNLADVVFAFVYSRLLAQFQAGLAEEGFRTFQHVDLSEHLRSLTPVAVEVADAPQLCDITWADDLVVFLQHRDPDTLLQRTKLASGLLFDMCWRRGLSPNFKKGKTEALVKLKGPGSRQLRLQTFQQKDPALNIPSTLRPDVQLRLVAKYRHLGHQIPASHKQDDEVYARVAQARVAYNKHRRTVFQNLDLPVQLRLRLSNSLVLSILAYNQGTWHLLAGRPWAHFSGAVLGFYRGLLRPEFGHEEIQSWSNERILAHLKAPGPEVILHLARLRYLGSLWRTAPLEVWWAIHYAGVWIPALQKALTWLHEHTSGLDFAAGAQWRQDNMCTIVASANEWKNLLQHAKRHAIETNIAAEHLHRWHYHFIHRAVELGLQADPDGLLRQGLQLDGPAEGATPKHACLLCGEAFTTFAGWAVHANRKHGRIAPERLFLQGSSCQVCCKEYHTSQRLLRHLRYSTQCAALLHGQGILPQAVRPGLGNTHVDRDANLPLPVCPAAETEVCDWETVSALSLRPGYSRPLLDALLADFDVFVQLEQRDEESFLTQCMHRICTTVEPFPVLQQTVQKLLDLFVDDDNQLLHRLPHGELGARLWARLRPEIEVLSMVQNVTQRVAPHEIRGAVYQGLHQTRFRPFRWQVQQNVPRARSRELLVLHLFSGHRRQGDLSEYLQNLPAPPGAIIVTLAIDIIFDSIRCDLSRQATQEKWIQYARLGGVLAFIAGPPCESWSAARAEGGRAGDHSGDGGPRLIRSWNFPFGLPAVKPDERAHLSLANKLLLFTVSMALELLAWIGFFLIEHPSPPENARGRDLATIWETGPFRALCAHPEVTMVHLLQGHFGAKSPKPTSFMVKGLPTLQGRLAEMGTLPLPKALRLGQTNGVFHTASLKEYPWRLCAAIGAAVRDSIENLSPHDTTYDLVNEERKTWVAEIKRNQNTSALMGADRAGAG